MKKTVIFIWILLFCYSGIIFSSGKVFSKNIIKLKPVSGKIKIDGKLGKNEWDDIKSLPLIMYQPTYLGKQSQITQFKIAFDEFNLYAAVYCYDSQPDKIRVNSLTRDRFRGGDSFSILIDTFNDKNNALLFITNAAGIRIDYALSSDGQSWNSSLDTFWEVKSTQNQEGWFAEFKIPFSSLGFKKVKEKVIIGLIVSRYISRENETQVFPDINPKWAVNTPSQSQEMELTNIQTKKPIYITPYARGGFGNNTVLNFAEDTFLKEGQRDMDFGLDIKYNFTNNLTLDATVNTDFAQAEADNQEINLTRFSLFFPEKRRFFQERSGIFSFRTSFWSYNQVFHSRQIGLYDGQEIPILGGLRLVGKSGPWDIGIINMQTAKSEFLPSENFGILRFRRQVLNPYSYAGIIFTNRMDFKGNRNSVIGIDCNLRLFADEYLTLKWAKVFDQSLDEVLSDDILSTSSFIGQWQRRSRKGLSYSFGFSHSGKEFNPGIGFIQRRDFSEFSWSINYNWLQGEKSKFRELNPVQLFGYVTVRNEDKVIDSAQIEWDTDFVWKNGGSIWADIELYYENLPLDLDFPENTKIPKGEYTFYKVEGGYNMGNSYRFRGSILFGLGSFYDGMRYQMGLYTSWNPSRYFGMYLEYDYNLLDFPDRDQGFDAHMIRLRIESAVNNKLSLNGFIQINSTGDLISTNLRFRYNFNEGHDIWLVFNQGLNLDRYRYTAVLPSINDQAVLLKYTYTFAL